MHKEKTALFTQYWLYEYLFIPFSLYNALWNFQFFINKVLRERLNNFFIAYLDDILIYINSKEEHIWHFSSVPEKLYKAKLFLDIKNCEFNIREIKYLRLIITIKRLRIDLKKSKKNPGMECSLIYKRSSSFIRIDELLSNVCGSIF